MLKRKENSFGANRQRPRECVALMIALPQSFLLIKRPTGMLTNSPGAGMLTGFRFSSRYTAKYISFHVSGSNPHDYDRLTRGRMPSPRNHFPLQSSRFSLDYLLLPPRSAHKSRSTPPHGFGFVTSLSPSYSEGCKRG